MDKALEELAKRQDRGLFWFSLRLVGVQLLLVLLCLPFAMLVNMICKHYGIVHDVNMEGWIAEMGLLQSLLVVGIVGPLIETILFQVVAVELSRLFTKNQVIQLVAAAAFFCAAHFSNSVTSGILAGGVGGFVLALAYLVGRQRSFGRAFAGTYLTHAMWNILLLTVSFGAEYLVRSFGG